jgi:hypothetical protein
MTDGAMPEATASAEVSRPPIHEIVARTDAAMGSQPPRRLIASGTVAGTSHKYSGKPNQDSRAIIQADVLGKPVTVGVVTDGCGDAEFSQVGSVVFARAIAAAVFDRLAINAPFPGDAWEAEDIVDLLEDVRQTTLLRLRIMLDWLLPSEETRRQVRHKVLIDHLLFTVVVVIEAFGRTVIAHIGDGYAMVNGLSIPLPKFAGNAPSYLAYALTASTVRNDLGFKILVDRPTTDVGTFLIGTDGLDELVRHANLGTPMPGQATGKVPPLEEFTEPRYFTNADLISRKLRLIQGGVDPAAKGGLLDDDTTLIVGRRA